MGQDRSKSLRVLLVDDEQAYVDVLARRMRKRGLEAVPTTSGIEALRALRHHDFDVAVVDLKMEGMDGLEVLKIIKKIAPEIKVVILTGHGGETEARDSIAAGAFDYVVKPCSIEDLVEKVLLAADA